MKITTSKANGTVHFGIECQCGWITVGHWTLESAGRAADKHIAAKALQMFKEEGLR